MCTFAPHRLETPCLSLSQYWTRGAEHIMNSARQTVHTLRSSNPGQDIDIIHNILDLIIPRAPREKREKRVGLFALLCRDNSENRGKKTKTKSLSGKTQGIWKFHQNRMKTQNLVCSSCKNSLILKSKDIAIFATEFSFLKI